LDISALLYASTKGPKAAAAIIWSLVQFGFSLSKYEYLNFRSPFRMGIGLIITIGWAIAVICLGLFRSWWDNGSSSFSYTSDPDSKSTPGSTVVRLTTAGLVLGCVATYVFLFLFYTSVLLTACSVIQIAICWISFRRMTLHPRLEEDRQRCHQERPSAKLPQ
jgi:hypothetical protein